MYIDSIPPPPCFHSITNRKFLSTYKTGHYQLIPTNYHLSSGRLTDRLLRSTAADFREIHLREIDRLNPERFHRLPCATREVGNLDGCAALRLGFFCDFAQTAPRSEVIHIHVERETVLETVHPAQVHEEVHSSVSADLLSDLPELGPERMPVFFAVFRRALLVESAARGVLLGFPRTGTRGALDVYPERIVHENAVRSLDCVYAAVRMGNGAREVEQNHLALHGADERRVVSADEVLLVCFEILAFPARIALADQIPYGFRLHRVQVVEPVAAVDVHVLRDRTKTVRRIVVAAMFLVPLGTEFTYLVSTRRTAV